MLTKTKQSTRSKDTVYQDLLTQEKLRTLRIGGSWFISVNYMLIAFCTARSLFSHSVYDNSIKYVLLWTLFAFFIAITALAVLRHIKPAYLGKYWEIKGGGIAFVIGTFWAVINHLTARHGLPIMSDYLTLIIIFSALISYYSSSIISYSLAIPLWVILFYHTWFLENEDFWINNFTLCMLIFSFESGRRMLNRLFYLIVRRNYSNLRLLKQTKKLANRDALTGVHSRRWLDLEIKKSVRNSLSYNQVFSLLFIDVDYFKNYNDYYGHQAGDECLVRLTHCLVTQLRSGQDNIARYGGEEFVLILRNTSHEQAIVVAERIQNALFKAAIPHENSPDSHYLTISQGIAQWTPELTIKQLLRLADLALYKVKSQGRNNILYLPPDALIADIGNVESTQL